MHQDSLLNLFQIVAAASYKKVVMSDGKIAIAKIGIRKELAMVQRDFNQNYHCTQLSLLYSTITWLMQFNPTKCVVLTVTNKLSPITSQYKLYNHLLAHVSEAKYLGLTLDKHLNFNKHIDVTCKKANASLAFIRRNTYFCNRNVKIDAYKTYVLPIMEYAAFVWSPHTSQNINKLETIQRRAARFVMSSPQ